MIRKQVTLIPNVSNIHIGKESNSEQTAIHFKTELYPDKTCLHLVSGKWEIEKVVGSLVTLVNHDDVIPENHD